MAPSTTSEPCGQAANILAASTPWIFGDLKPHLGFGTWGHEANLFGGPAS
jgi:hypothetical protein